MQTSTLTVVYCKMATYPKNEVLSSGEKLRSK